MDATFGTRLRLQRERSHIALESIAEQTKIKLSLLEDLERDDVTRWPPGLFRRSYMRAYAEAIGLDPEPAVREFVTLHPEPTESIQDFWDARVARDTTDRPPTRLRVLLGSAMSALPGRRSQRETSSDALHQASADAPPVSLSSAEILPTLSVPPAFEEHRVRQSMDPMPEVSRATEPTLAMVADLCTRLGRAANAAELTPVLEDVAGALDAVGLVLWLWDARVSALVPVLAHGYSDQTRAQLPRVSRHSDNALGAAFESEEICVVNGAAGATGAIVAPLLTPGHCAGVLALELREGAEQRPLVRAVAVILAAQLSTFLGSPAVAEALTA
jgi:hypothetical protein